MASITITIKPYQGDYPLDLDEQPFTTLEWRWIKQLAGYLPLTVQEGFEGVDPDLFVALAVIALHRNGRITRQDAARVADKLADAAFDGASILFVGDPDAEDGDADDPPAEAPTTSSSANGGPSSTQLSEPSDESPNPIGHPV